MKSVLASRKPVGNHELVVLLTYGMGGNFNNERGKKMIRAIIHGLSTFAILVVLYYVTPGYKDYVKVKTIGDRHTVAMNDTLWTLETVRLDDPVIVPASVPTAAVARGDVVNILGWNAIWGGSDTSVIIRTDRKSIIMITTYNIISKK